MNKRINILVTKHKHKLLAGLPHKHSNWSHSFDMNRWNALYDKFGLCDHKTLDEIVPGEKYIIYISVYRDILDKAYNPMFAFHRDSRLKLSRYPMPLRVKKDNRKGRVHWIIDFSTECEQLNEQWGTDTAKLLQTLNTTPDNVTLLTGSSSFGSTGRLLSDDALTNKRYNVVTGYDLFDFVNLDNHNEYIQEKLSLILRKSIMPYKSLCYNRLPRQHRTVIVAHIMNKKYEDQTLFSLGTFSKIPKESRWFNWRSYFPEYENQFKILETAGDIYPSIKEKEADLQVNLAPTTGWIHGLNSSFQLVTETHSPNAPYPFLTEKTLKSCAMLQPFIQCGPMNNIKFLKEFGYNTFDTYIDHSYDSEPDDVKRLRMVLAEFDRLQAIPAEQWANMLYDMTEDLLHNAYLVKNSPARCTESQLVPILMKHCNG